MKPIPLLLFVAVTAVCVTVSMPFTAGGADDEGSPIYGVKIPAGYREWALVNVAHEAGDLNDFRAVLGNAIAMKAFQDASLPGRYDHCQAGLEIRAVDRKQRSLWPAPIFRYRGPHES